MSREAIEVTRLDDGLTVVTEALPEARSVSLGFWVGTGSVDEDPSLAGTSHFLEHLLFKGTATRSAREISRATDSVGCDLNAFTTKEHTAFHAWLPSDRLDLALDVLSDIIWAPAFRTGEVEAERQVILEEILMHADTPGDAVHEVFGRAMWPGHPLGRDVLGEAETVSCISRDQIAEFHEAHYRPGNLVVAAAGRVNHDRIVDGIAGRRVGVTGGGSPSRTAPPAPSRAAVVERRRTEQAHLVIGVAAPGRDDEDRHQLGILDHVLGGGVSSRLFQSIREDRGLAYSVYSYRLSFSGAGALAVYAGTSASHAEAVHALVVEELDRLAAEGVSEEELEGAKGHLRGSLVLGLEDPEARMSRLGYSQLVHGRVLSVEEVEQRITGVTLEEVNELAARVLTGPRVLAAIGPLPKRFGATV
ncbi:MAG: insulinase family protein [Acidimicrobiaceae bacterium]|nr:insulinase family protein [Acidimicrobiaceae bacterium]